MTTNMTNVPVLESQLRAFWREYCRQVGKPNMAVAECGHMNNELDIEHKMIAQRISLLWDTISPRDIDSHQICGTNQVSDPMIVIPDAEWEAAGTGEDPETYLTAGLQINGTRLQLEAFQCKPSVSKGQVQSFVMFHGVDVAAARQVGKEHTYKTLPIRGRDYVVVATSAQEN